MTLRRLPDGEWVKEPDLPPNTLCGGLRSPYYPNLTEAELETIANDPASLPWAARSAAEELAARRARRRD
jgi:hypothetical protein